MNAARTVKEAVFNLKQAYYILKDPDALLSCVTDDIRWLDTTANKLLIGKEALRAAYEKELANPQNTWNLSGSRILNEWQLGDNLIGVATSIHLERPSHTYMSASLRQTIICCKKDNYYKVKVVHSSLDFNLHEQRELLKSLALSRNELNSIINAIPGGVALYKFLDDKPELVYCSQGVAKLIGYSVEEYSRLKPEKILHPEDGWVPSKIAEAYKTNTPINITYRIIHKNGSIVWVQLQGAVVNIENDVPTWQCVFHNVTEQVNNKAEKEILHERLEKIFENIPGGVCLYKWDGQKLRPLFVNKNFSKMLGRDFKEDINATEGINYKYVHPADLPGLKSSILEGLAGDGTLNYSYRIYSKRLNDYIWIKSQATSSHISDGSLAVYCIYTNITKEKNLQYKLEENQQTLNTIIQSRKLFFWEYFPSEQIAILSQPLQDALHSRTIINNFPQNVSADFLHPDSLPIYMELHDRVKRGETSSSCDVQVLVGGVYRWYKLLYTPIYDRNSRLVKYIGTAQNIDSYKALENFYQLEIQRSSNSSGNLLGFATSNLISGEVLEYKIVNRCGSPASIANHEHLLSIMTDYIFDRNDAQKLLQLFSRKSLISLSAKSQQVELSYIKFEPGSSPIWVKTQVRFLHDPSTDSLLALFCTYNINDEKMYQEVIDSAVAYDHDLVAHINLNTDSAVFFSGKNYYRTFVNNSKGYKSIYQDYCDTFVVPEEKESFMQKVSAANIRQALSADNTYEFIYHCNENGFGLRTKRLRFVNYNRDLAIVIMTQTDITELINQQEKQKKQLADALEKAKVANAAKTSFLSRLSHDMRTPMNGILGLTYLASEKKDVSEIKADLNQIDQSGHYLLNLINDTLDLNKIETGKLELHPSIVPGEKIFAHLTAVLLPLMKEKEISFITNLTRIHWPVLNVDVTRIEQILVNLISNSIKFTPPQGTIELAIEIIAQSSTSLVSSFTIKDNGIGMSAEFLPHVFEPFSQEHSKSNDNKYPGTGLGMTIVKKLVEMMNGKISVSSQIGKGTEIVFSLILPIAKETDTIEFSGEKSTTNLKGKHILLCEDHPLNALIAKQMLLRRGMTVETASNGLEGLKLFTQNEPGHFDAILMDILMPELNGLETTRRIRALDREDAQSIPIIALSANAFDEDRRKSSEAGMNVHITKPIDPKVLYTTLANIVKA